MNNTCRTDGRLAFLLTLAVAFFVGVFLRCYLLSDQVLIDDEWHGFYFALGKSPQYLLTHFSIPGATCIPLNFYSWLLGATIGWSENWLRLPSILCGIACLLIGPMLARKIIGRQRSALLALLLAISPILIFYSRNARPYSAVAFLGFIALLLGALWMQTGARRYGNGFAIAGVLAVYFHLFAVVTIAAPVLTILAMHLHARFWKKSSSAVAGPPWRDLIDIAICMMAAGVVLIVPALLRSMRHSFFDVALVGTFEPKSLPRLASLISGTAQPAVVILFWVLVCIGAIEQFRRASWITGMFLVLFPLHALALLLSKPDGAQSAIVLARYCIPLVPVTLMFAACGVAAIFEFLAGTISLRPAWWMVPLATFPIVLLCVSPLARIDAAPNNFTGHGAFQHDYGPNNWDRSFSSEITQTGVALNTIIHADEISPFYRKLGESPSARPIVEYPMMIGDQLNPLYYYQHFHRRPVIVGYASDVHFKDSLAFGGVSENTYVDQVLSMIKDQSCLKFRNFIPMEDLGTMRSRNVEYIILHERYEGSMAGRALPLEDAPRLRREFRAKLGDPFYEDADITVFRLDY